MELPEVSVAFGTDDEVTPGQLTDLVFDADGRTQSEIPTPGLGTPAGRHDRGRRLVAATARLPSPRGEVVDRPGRGTGPARHRAAAYCAEEGAARHLEDPRFVVATTVAVRGTPWNRPISPNPSPSPSERTRRVVPSLLVTSTSNRPPRMA